VQQCIEPALAAGHWVLSDRFSGSTAAYQGYGRGLPLDLIAQLAEIATGGLQPDLTLLLELPLQESLRRRGQRPADRIEASGEAFLQRVCDGFAALAAQPGWCRLDAHQPPDQVSAAIQRAIRERCPRPPSHG
jgi:dTMP kinase